MTTVLPPPSKRQRTDAAEKSRQQQEIEVIPSDAGTLRIQFFDETTGLPIQGLTLVPVADATPKNLESLLNTLQGHVREFLDCCEQFSKYNIRMMLPNISHTGSHSQFPRRVQAKCLQQRFLPMCGKV